MNNNISKHGEHSGLRLANICKLHRKPSIQVLAYIQILEAQNINIYNTQKVNISKHGEHRGLRLANIYKLYRKPTIQVLAHMQV